MVGLPVNKVVPLSFQQKIQFKAVMKMFGLHRKFVVADHLINGEPCHFL